MRLKNVKRIRDKKPFRMSSINPNRSSLIIARLESSFELSSFPLEQISIFYKIHLEYTMTLRLPSKYDILIFVNLPI